MATYTSTPSSTAIHPGSAGTRSPERVAESRVTWIRRSPGWRVAVSDPSAPRACSTSTNSSTTVAGRRAVDPSV